ncbi:DUF882 domain-containing protein [Chelativorans sp. ZYF759]|nr:DUF882 domain-containing protein [Chelativorans sp. ZYF759]
MASVSASAETRTLRLHFTHTNERAEITFKRNGRYIKEGLDKINWILRDWRRNEATEMDPQVLDLLWEVYQQSGSRAYIHVISAYRSPATNQMLRSRSSGVADNSQHTRGKAIDFFLPDVSPAKLRELGLRRHGGGVGYYPSSGSPFVHLDSGSVRHWPRMNRQQLMAVFPDGKTIHVPSDGRPLPGYQQAMAEYESRQRGRGSVQVASGDSSPAGSSSGGGFLSALFGGNRSSSNQQAAQAAAPASAGTATARAAAPTPSAPVRQSEERPATPETILAALPPSRVPIPMTAPRPSAPVGVATQAAPSPEAAPTAQAVAEARPVPPAEVPFEVRDEAEILRELEERRSAQTTQTAQMAPIPMPRPDRGAPAESSLVVASADSIPESISALSSQSRDAGSEAIEGLLASAGGGSVPVPLMRSRASEPEAPTSGMMAGDSERSPIVLAALPESASARASGALSNSDSADAAAAKQRALAATGDNRLAPISAAASPRRAIMARQEGVDAVAALDSGVRTTGKSARPSVQDARTRSRRPQNMPVEAESARWAFETASISTVTNGTRAPSFAQGPLTSTPQAVYTAGFQQVAVADVHRFRGNAVQFMSVARFRAN